MEVPGAGGPPPPTRPPEKGERGREGSAPALSGRVSKRVSVDLSPPSAPAQPPRSEPPAPAAVLPPTRDEMATEAWNLYQRANAAGDLQTATRALRTACELTGMLGQVNRRKRGSSDLAERLAKAAALLDKIPGVK